MRQGRVVRAAGGFFSVRDDGDVEYLCRARGSLKKSRAALIVGDRVLFRPREHGSDHHPPEGVIETVLPRQSFLSRPPVANVDQVVVVMAFREPECDWQLVSRLLVLAEQENLRAVLCLNKADLAGAGRLEEVRGEIAPFPYPLLYTSAVSRKGLEELEEMLGGCCSVFAGPSGVGKSSLLNALQPDLALQVGSVSAKIKRGRHTTRRAELLPLGGGGSVVDTPGFTRLEFADLPPEQLAGLFPEMEALRSRCAFRNCLHLTEPRCAVRREIGGALNPLRYEHYSFFLEELNRQEGY